MSTFRPLLVASLAALALGGCDQLSSLVGGAEEETGEGIVTGEGSGGPGDAVSSATDGSDLAGELAGELDAATPMEERVATLGLLNKRNNVTLDLNLRPGESVEEGPVIVRLEACERTAPYEFPQETGAFVQLDVLDRGQDEHTRVFSGWLFKENPSLNVVEHPVYDVWVKDCAMRFPGEPPLGPSPSQAEPPAEAN